jgi:cytochrome P450
MNLTTASLLPARAPRRPVYEPYRQDILADPYPAYETLRRTSPVYRCEAGDFYVLSRYQEVSQAARAHAVFSSRDGIGLNRTPGVPMMIMQDPPNHTRLRAVVSKAFNPRTIASLEGRVRAIAAGLLDAALGRGRFDLVEDVAVPLPLLVIAEMLGVEPERYPDFKRWTDAALGALSTGGISFEAAARYMAAWPEFKAYFLGMLAQQREQPQDNLLSALVAARVDGDALSPSEILNFCLLLLIAGTETTMNLIGNAVLALLVHPAEAARLRRDPGLVPALIEETLRWDAPVQGTFRTTLCDVILAGSAIPKGSRVLLLWGSAGRDEERYPEPERFDLGRAHEHHLGFGAGIHTCLGGPLARLEGRVLFEELLARGVTLRLDPERPVERRPDPFFRGPIRLPLLASSEGGAS